MAKKKNYIDNDELKEEIVKCINDGYNRALSFGFVAESDAFDSDDEEKIRIHEESLSLGYNPERSNWIKKIRTFDEDNLKEMVSRGEVSDQEADIIREQMRKPIVSDRLARMFQLIVDNVARSFYWQNPDDGLDCKANAMLDLCSNFWKFEPVDLKGKEYNAFSFCTQISYFGIAGAHRILYPKKYANTISLSCLDEHGKSFDIYNI